MSHPQSPPLNPSEAVERIREIIVGRQLERLEQRVAILETSGPSESGAAAPAQRPTPQARLDELRREVREMVDANHERLDARLNQYFQETQELSARIQAVAAEKAGAAAGGETSRELEYKVGGWLNEFQNSLKNHLIQRDQNLLSQVRAEISVLWETMEQQFTRLESRTLDRDAVERRFERIAQAARALADSAAPSTPSSAK